MEALAKTDQEFTDLQMRMLVVLRQFYEQAPSFAEARVVPTQAYVDTWVRQGCRMLVRVALFVCLMLPNLASTV